MLSPEQIKARDGKLTASRVGVLMTGSSADVLNLWREMIGDPEFEPKDLSDVWAVQLGMETEKLNLYWYERRTKHMVNRVGEVVVHHDYDWAACTLDGWDIDCNCPIECKHVGGKEPRAKIIERYKPQFHWQMFVCDRRRVMLSLIEGAKEPVIEEISLDEEYAANLFARASLFMNCVNNLTPPVIF